MPFNTMTAWLENEKILGSPNPNNIVLATATPQGVPHSRVVAIREIHPDGVLFFTQDRKRKALELLQNPRASMTLWLPLQQAEVILDGVVHPLDVQETHKFWDSLPRERQLLFATYARTSDKQIASQNELQVTMDALDEKYQQIDIPRSESYIGFKFVPKTFYFYKLATGGFSELTKYESTSSGWQQCMLSP